MKQTAKSLEKKISTIKKISKITTAMKVIATINTRKTKKQIQNTLIRKEAIQEIFSTIEYLATLDIIKNKLKTNFKKKLWIVFSSDLGLCGAYNSRIYQELEPKIGSKDELIIFGIKGQKHFSYKNWKILKYFPINQFLDEGLQWLLEFLEKNYFQYKEVNVIYTLFGLNLPMKVKTEKLNPIKNKKNQKETNFVLQFKIEQDPWTLYKTTLPFYWESLLILYYWNSKASEEKTRQFAMDNASENAQKMVNDLQLEFNQLRQEKITKEILLVSQED